MSLTISYLAPRYSIVRFPKMEERRGYAIPDQPPHKEWQRSLKIWCSNQTCQWVCWTLPSAVMFIPLPASAKG